jgi:sulfhydrogenase subunit beta (sulfur reductase)
MNHTFLISKESFDKVLLALLQDYYVFAPVLINGNQDYRLICEDDLNQIVYNTPKPTTPLKTFFLPVKENVVGTIKEARMRIIIGIPSCDLMALGILDAIYLSEPIDMYYQHKRENTILIGTDCYSIQEHCHCTTYGIQPYPEKYHDISLSVLNKDVYLTINSERGENLFKKLSVYESFKGTGENDLKDVINKRNEVVRLLTDTNKNLPDYKTTGELIKGSGEDIWQKHARTCVSCGACATICPTCTCFLLIDRPEFEKVRQLDACQYPAFEKVAAGEDPLGKRHVRFRNRYLCKYVWKPEKFGPAACTGCGRCIEACIGKINKNELFKELAGVLV